MKKKIIIGLSVFSLFFLAIVLYFILHTDRVIAELDTIIKLHRVELLREHLLINIKKMQCDINLCTTKYASSIDTVENHAREANRILAICVECHHPETVTNKLRTVKLRTEKYVSNVRRIVAMPSNTAVKAAQKDSTFRSGLRLVKDIDAFTTATHHELEIKTETALREITRKQQMLYLLLGIVPLAGLGLSLVFSRYVTKPIKHLVTATKRVQGGDLEHRISGLKDEYGAVATSFNEMAASLKEYCLRMQWAEQLVLLGELAGGLAHEMKNPLAGIKVSMKVLSRDQSLSPENRDVLVKVIDQIRRIEILLKNLLNFSKPPKQQAVFMKVNAVLDAAISLILKHPSFSTRSPKTIAIEKEFDSRLPVIMADPFQLQQVVMNLLINAAEAMPSGGKVVVKTLYDEAAGSLSITVTDTGPGIDQSLHDKIFSTFFTTKEKGTGLGLTITKRLVEQHGGSIRVENVPDGGASFIITLPVPPGEEVPPA